MKLLNLKMSWSHLISLVNEDSKTFETHLFILDPELNLDNKNSELANYLKNHDNIRFKVNDPRSNVFILPGNKPIEEMLWSYINNIAADHPFFDDTYIMNAGLTPKIIKNLNKDIEKDSNFYKHWFKNLNETTNYIEYFMKRELSNQVRKKLFAHS